MTCLPAEELATQMAPTGAADTEPSFGDPTVDAAPSVVVAATVMPPQIVKSPGAPPVASAYVEPPKMRASTWAMSRGGPWGGRWGTPWACYVRCPPPTIAGRGSEFNGISSLSGSEFRIPNFPAETIAGVEA